MNDTTIGLIAAMPDECRPLLRRVGAVHRDRLAGLPCYRFTIAGRPCILIESGMGTLRAAHACEVLLASQQVAVLINFGFGGAALPGPAVGDLVVAERILGCTAGAFTDERGLADQLRPPLVQLLAQGMTGRVFTGTFITTTGIERKDELARRLPSGADNPVLEMETAAVARTAAAHRVPLLAIRAISDGAAEELDFAITDFTDHDLNIRLSRVLAALARKPRLLPQLLRLARNTRLAGEQLATALLHILAALPVAGTPASDA